jgi:F-type H+-transporting ATPase subunit delta
MIREPVSRRYAHALFEAAWDEGEAQSPAKDLAARREAGRQHVTELGENLQAIDRFLDDPTNREWRDLLLAPQISHEERERIIDRLFSERAHPLVLRLLRLMLRKKRIAALGEVWEAYSVLLDEARGVVRAEVTTAVPLRDDLREALRRALRERLARETRSGRMARAAPVADVLIDTRIDPSLLGGVRVQIGDRVIEHSVRRSLEEITEKLLAAPVLE